MLDPTVTERIRSIFLHDETRVTIEMAARMLGRSGGEIAAAIEDGEIETTSGCSGPMIDIHELAEQAVHVWPIDAIEEALSPHFSHHSCCGRGNWLVCFVALGRAPRRSVQLRLRRAPVARLASKPVCAASRRNGVRN